MNCRRCQSALNAYLDYELGPPASGLLEGHLQACPECRQALETLQAIRGQLRRPELRSAAPAGLRQVRDQLRAGRETIAGRVQLGRRRPAWLRIAAAGLVAAGLGLLWLAPPWGGQGSSERRLARMVVALHSQFLTPEPPLGIRSADPAAVSSWLAEQAGLIVPVENPTGEGFSLQGAWTTQVGRQKAAVLIYRREGHLITLFIWHQSTPPRRKEVLYAEGGYRVMHWDQGTFTCWAVSDLDARALHRFCDALGG